MRAGASTRVHQSTHAHSINAEGSEELRIHPCSTIPCSSTEQARLPAPAACTISGAVAVPGAGAIAIRIGELVLGLLDSHVALVEGIFELRVVKLRDGRLLHPQCA